MPFIIIIDIIVIIIIIIFIVVMFIITHNGMGGLWGEGRGLLILAAGRQDKTGVLTFDLRPLVYYDAFAKRRQH